MPQKRQVIDPASDKRFVRRDDPTDDPLAHPDEAGAYVGRKPERQAETIPGGVQSKDERMAAHSTQTGPIGGGSADEPAGHRNGPAANDDLARDTGGNG
jgi:hypothetical protein